MTGAWEERGLAASYLETRSVHCDCCGRILVRRAWVVRDGDRELVFCAPDCERLYRLYRA